MNNALKKARGSIKTKDAKAKKAGWGRHAPSFSDAPVVKKRANGSKLLGRKTRALEYAKFGLLVVPMHSVKDGRCSCSKGTKCRNAGKHPATAHGVKDATTDRKTIKAWWSKDPKANIGIATGKKSKVVVLDIDPRNGGNETLAALTAELGPLPTTVSSKTGGGGKHLVFKYPDFWVPKDSAGKVLGSGVDILSDGAIMVAPLSLHESGKRYKWITGKTFEDIKPASFPKRWLAKLKGGDPTEKPKQTAEAVVEGTRNNALTSLAGTMQRSGASPQTILAALKEENKAKCSPPLDDGEVEKIANSITQYAAPPGGDRSDDAEKLLTVVLNQHFEGGKHLLFAADGQFWLYTGTMWSPAKANWIDGRILESIEDSPFKTSQQTSGLIRQVKTLLAAKLARNDDPLGLLTEPKCIINCRNGEVWISDDGTIELRKHDPKSYLRHCLDVEYDAQAKCKEYDRAVLGIFANTKNPRYLRRHWNELVGYLIQPRRNFPVIVIMLGGGDNGKTALARTIVKLMGQAQVQAQRVDELGNNRFAMGSLLGKLLFLDDDVKAGARLPDGTLKTISEAKEVTGENKYKPSFNFVVRAVPMLLCNNVPSLADLSHGMMKRLMVIPFDRTFTDKDKDSGLFERIWANEMPGVLNKALKGYARLLKRGRFKKPLAVVKATAGWVQQANPIPAFLDERCSKVPAAECWMKILYPAYKIWATDAGFTMIQNQLNFRKNLEHMGFKAEHGNKGQKVKGLALKA
jgi:putative DNA primase/helicase